jgi:hypothetical protein
MSDEKAVVHAPPCTNAEEFFQKISPLSEYFRHWENSYFRGHADDRWELVPNAFRIKKPPVLTSGTQLNHIRYGWGEVETVSVEFNSNILVDRFMDGVNEALGWNSCFTSHCQSTRLLHCSVCSAIMESREQLFTRGMALQQER